MKKKIADLKAGDLLEVEFEKEGKKIETVKTIEHNPMIRGMIMIEFKSGNWTHEHRESTVNTINN